jgi:hypothetical protein
MQSKDQHQVHDMALPEDDAVVSKHDVMASVTRLCEVNEVVWRVSVEA